MSVAARIVARTLLGLAGALLVAGVLVAALGLYVGTWPIRRAMRDEERHAKTRALQELLFALAGCVAVQRRVDG